MGFDPAAWEHGGRAAAARDAALLCAAQNTSLRAALRRTGDAPLVCFHPSGGAWGVDAQGRGGNLVGAALERARTRLACPAPVRVPLPGRGAAWMVCDLLTAAECAAYVRAAEEAGFAALPEGVYVNAHGARDNDRALLRDPQFASLVERRLRQSGALPAGRVAGVNDHFRCCRYRRGQRFPKHLDFPVQCDDGRRSRYTVNIYLNDGYAGGRTLFYAAEGDEEPVFAVRGCVGMAVVFEQTPTAGGPDLWHAGEEMTGEGDVKYITRTDVLYEQ